MPPQSKARTETLMPLRPKTSSATPPASLSGSFGTHSKPILKSKARVEKEAAARRYNEERGVEPGAIGSAEMAVVPLTAKGTKFSGTEE